MLVVRGQRSSDIQRFASRQDGSASAEHAVLFGVVIACLSAGIYCLGQLSKGGFNSAAAAVNSAVPNSLATALDHDTNTTPDELQTAEDPSGGSRWQIVTLGAVMFIACTAPLTYIVVKPKLQKKKQTKEGPEAEAKLHEAPNPEQQAFEKRQELRRVFQNSMASLLNGQLKVRQIMSRQLTCVRKSESVKAIQELMELKKIRYVIVSNTDGTLLGIVSKKDCTDRSGNRAADIMTANPISLEADSEVSPAVTMLVSKRISCLPITSEGKLAGVLTTTDFLMALQCALNTLGNVAEHLAPAGHRAGSAKPPQLASQIAAKAATPPNQQA